MHSVFPESSQSKEFNPPFWKGIESEQLAKQSHLDGSDLSNLNVSPSNLGLLEDQSVPYQGPGMHTCVSQVPVVPQYRWSTNSVIDKYGIPAAVDVFSPYVPNCYTMCVKNFQEPGHAIMKPLATAPYQLDPALYTDQPDQTVPSNRGWDDLTVVAPTIRESSSLIFPKPPKSATSQGHRNPKFKLRREPKRGTRNSVQFCRLRKQLRFDELKEEHSFKSTCLRELRQLIEEAREIRGI